MNTVERIDVYDHLEDIPEEPDDFETNLPETSLQVLFSEVMAMAIQEYPDDEIMYYISRDESRMAYFERRSFRMVKSEIEDKLRVEEMTEMEKAKVLRVFQETYLKSLSATKPILEELSKKLPRYKVIANREYIEDKIAKKEISALQEIVELRKYLDPVPRRRLKELCERGDPKLLKEINPWMINLRKIGALLQRAETYLPKPQTSSLETSS